MSTFNSWLFALFSANLHRYLPAIPWERHKIIYRKWENYHRERSLDKLLSNKIVSPQFFKELQSPSIISLFHLSDHLVWPVLLAKDGIQFNVLLDRAVYLDAASVFDQLLRELGAFGYTPELLFSDDPALLLKIRSCKASGQHLLCFADGASGSSSAKKDERVAIKFLEGTLWLKKGIPFISHLFRMPVALLLPHTMGNVQQLQFHKTISSSPNEAREVYIHRCLHELYSGLEKIIENAPYAWECWGYLHQNGMLGKISESQFVGGREAVIQVGCRDKVIDFDRVNYAVRLE